MYPLRGREMNGQEAPAIPEDCYAEKARNFYWVLGILFLGVIAFLVIKYAGENNPSGLAGPVEQYAKTVAYSPCPYCPGSLDSQGRCNVRDCPVYSPDWGKAAAQDPAARDKVTLIRELAAEVSSVAEGAVIIHSIYIGGNAQKAGLLKGDLIITFNGRTVKKARQFQKIAALAKPETPVDIEYLRDGEKFRARVMIGEGEMEGAVKPVALQSGIVYPGMIRR